MKRRATLALGALLAGAALAQAPGDYEMELWRAAARLDTTAAYDAYLAAFPNGAFAAMARAALAKHTPPAAAVTSGPASTAAPLLPDTLPALAGEVSSGATGLAVGARLQGPGVLTVGSLGARRQLLLPPGPWTLLAAVDHRAPGTVQVGMATLAFGQFSGRQLRSLLLASFNRRSITIPGGSTQTQQALGLLPRWPSAERCEARSGQEHWLDVGGSRTLHHCAAVRPAGDWREALAGPPVLDALQQSLQALGVALPAFATRSELHFTDLHYGLFGLLRLDSAEAGAAAERSAAWQRYLPVATLGQGRDIELEDLQPGQPAQPAAAALPL